MLMFDNRALRAFATSGWPCNSVQWRLSNWAPNWTAAAVGDRDCAPTRMRCFRGFFVHSQRRASSASKSPMGMSDKSAGILALLLLGGRNAVCRAMCCSLMLHAADAIVRCLVVHAVHPHHGEVSKHHDQRGDEDRHGATHTCYVSGIHQHGLKRWAVGFSDACSAHVISTLACWRIRPLCIRRASWYSACHACLVSSQQLQQPPMYNHPAWPLLWQVGHHSAATCGATWRSSHEVPTFQAC